VKVFSGGKEVVLQVPFFSPPPKHARRPPGGYLQQAEFRIEVPVEGVNRDFRNPKRNRRTSLGFRVSENFVQRLFSLRAPRRGFTATWNARPVAPFDLSLEEKDLRGVLLGDGVRSMHR
jgi:hypothetical protein